MSSSSGNRCDNDKKLTCHSLAVQYSIINIVHKASVRDTTPFHDAIIQRSAFYFTTPPFPMLTSAISVRYIYRTACTVKWHFWSDFPSNMKYVHTVHTNGLMFTKYAFWVKVPGSTGLCTFLAPPAVDLIRYLHNTLLISVTLGIHSLFMILVFYEPLFLVRHLS